MALDRDQNDRKKVVCGWLLLDRDPLLQRQERWPRGQAMEGRAGGGREGAQ